MEHKHYTKRLMALLILTFTATSIMLAAPRSVEQARKAAAMQMQKHRANKAKAHGETGTALNPQLVLAKERQNKDEAYYYVFSAGRDLGYIIVSGDDRLPEIVGYTESGNYDADRLPENLVSFMQAYQDFADNATDAQIEEIRQWKAQVRHEQVAPLMEEKWNQMEPYNNMCPYYAPGERAVTGCVATAVAQILHHYGCPAKLMADIPAYTTYSNKISMPGISEGEQYDWQSMLNTYSGSETQAQNDAVAKLMLHVGCAVSMDYGPSSGAGATAETFTKFFGMDKELVRQVFRDSYNISQWDNMLYNELAAQRPVYYDGQSTGGGHAFVVHGYDDGLYYVNWGWGGYCDGYFDITILNPHNTSGAGASSSDDGYSMGNGMIIGITPDNGKVDEVSTPKITSVKKLQVSDASISGTQITANVTIAPQNSNLDGKINVSVGYADNNGKYVKIGTDPFEIDSENLPHGYYFITSTQISFNYEEGKTYKLCLIESVDNQNWTACDGEETTSTTIKIENQTCTEVSQNYTLTATAELDTENSGGYAGMSNTINITVSNSGDKEYYDKVYIRVGTGATMPEGYTYATGITAPINGSTTFNFAYTPQAAGTYNFWILDVNGQEIGNSSITFQATSAPVLSFVSIKCSNASGEKVYADYQGNKVEMDKVNDTKADITFEIKNDGGYYEGVFYIYELTTSGNWSGYSKTLKIPANATTPFTFTVEGSAGSIAGMMLRSASDDVKIAGLTTANIHTIQGNIGSYSFTDSEICYLAGNGGTGINDINAEKENEDVYYNLRGEKVSNPTKGIYIKNGKKYLLK